MIVFFTFFSVWPSSPAASKKLKETETESPQKKHQTENQIEDESKKEQHKKRTAKILRWQRNSETLQLFL